MYFTRITAHFNTREQAQKAFSKLSKKCPEHFDNARAINKKVSFEHTADFKGVTKKQQRLIMEEAADNVQHYLNECEGFMYSVFVKH